VADQPVTWAGIVRAPRLASTRRAERQFWRAALKRRLSVGAAPAASRSGCDAFVRRLAARFAPMPQSAGHLLHCARAPVASLRYRHAACCSQENEAKT